MKQKLVLALSLLCVSVVGLVSLAQAAAPLNRSVAGEGRSGTGYLGITGTTFVPQRSGVNFRPTGSGGVAVTGGFIPFYMHAPVLLPDGALVQGFRLYYDDEDNSNRLRATLVRYDAAGSREELASTQSPVGDPGFGYADASLGSTPLEIDNARYSYAFEVDWLGASSDVSLRHVRLEFAGP